jgi:exosortase
MAGLGLGFLGVSMGNLWYAYGSAGVKTFGFGLAFFLIALPIPSVIYGQIISSLQHGITVVNVEVLALLGTPASIQGNLVQLPTGVLGVDEACSGIRSLQSTVMATLFIGYLTLERFGFRALLFVSGLLLAIFGNLIRVFSLSYSASIHGIEAVDAAHDVAGWSILMFTVVGVGVLSWVFGKMEAAMSRVGLQASDGI